MMKRELAIFLLLSVVTITGVYFWQPHIQSVEAAQLRPSFTLPDLQNKSHSNSEWDGKIVVVNFWATWCPPCVEEIPMFIELQKKYGEQGLQFIGIAMDDAESVKNFAEAMNINYPILLDVKRSKLAFDFGNQLGALPFTAIINRQGMIVDRQMGGVSRAEMLQMLEPLLKDKKPTASAT
jgi:thiol-disulfide isomerase/thioredoxin